MCSHISNCEIKRFMPIIFIALSLMKTIHCIVIFYTVDLYTFRLVQTVTKSKKNKVNLVVRKMWLILCIIC